MLVQFYQVNKSAMDSCAVNPGNLYFCTDINCLYMDTENNNRILIGKTIRYINTEAERTALSLSKIEINIIYYVIESKIAYIHNGFEWYSLSPKSYIIKNEKLLNTGWVTYTNSGNTENPFYYKYTIYLPPELIYITELSNITIDPVFDLSIIDLVPEFTSIELQWDVISFTQTPYIEFTTFTKPDYTLLCNIFIHY